MKTLILGVLLTGLSIQTYAQDVFFNESLKKEEVPTTIVEAIETDFPDYSITELAAVPVEYVEEDLMVNHNVDPNTDYDTYQLRLTEGNGRTLEAIYNMDGKLLSTVEHLKNITPPAPVRNSVSSNFPGWTIKKDVYRMIYKAGKETKEQYKFVLGKDNKTMRVYTDEKGDILKVS